MLKKDVREWLIKVDFADYNAENQQFPILYAGYLKKYWSYLDEIFRIDSA